jgi:hypothetical protein
MMKLGDKTTYTLMVEVLQLLAEHEVLQDGGTSGADLQTQLVLDRRTPIGGHVNVGVVTVERYTQGRSHGVNRHTATLLIAIAHALTVTALGKGTGRTSTSSNTSSIGQTGNGQRKPNTSHFGKRMTRSV